MSHKAGKQQGSHSIPSQQPSAKQPKRDETMASDELVYGLIFPLVGTILAWILSIAPVPHLIVSA